MSTELRALIFDVDGTLADTEEFHRRAFNAAFSAADLHWWWNRGTYRELLRVAGGRQRMRAFAEQEDRVTTARADFEELLTALHAAKTRRYDASLREEPLPLRPGIARLFDAGCDQLGGEFCTAEIVGAVRNGFVTESRLDESVVRVLTEKFTLGLFDSRHVDPAAAERIVASEDMVAAGLHAQRDSLTLLTNGATGAPTLPLASGLKVFAKNIDGAAFDGREVVDDPAEADVAVLRMAAGFEPRTQGFELFMHAGSLDYSDAERDEVLALCAAVPTVIVINLDRPAILTPFVDAAAAIIADYGATDRAVADVLLGIAEPKGQLPLDLPRSMASVVASNSDTPFDMPDALFRFGHGLRYGA